MQNNLKIKIGILCLQGAFIEHIAILNNLEIKDNNNNIINIETFEIRQEKDLTNNLDLDGLVLPGGESTTIGKLLIELNMLEHIQKLISNNLPVFGTCAGLILLAKELDNDDKKHIASMNIKVCRNAYGRQLGSFNAVEEFNNIKIPMTFIRAPYIKDIGTEVKILSKVDGKIVSAREQNQLVTAFHPELTDNKEVHNYFIEIIKSYKNL